MKKFFTYFLFGLLISTSCQNADDLAIASDNFEFDTEADILDSIFVDKTPAKQVALAGQPESAFTARNTRSSAPEVEDVSTIFNEKGEPVIYVVNYKSNEGYAMVSASKNYHPLLMKSDYGRFDPSSAPEAFSWYLNTYKADIERLKSAPYDAIKAYR